MNYDFLLGSLVPELIYFPKQEDESSLTKIQVLPKNTSIIPLQVNPTDAETIKRTVETRCRQLNIAAEMELWRECFNTAEDLHGLMTKKRPQMRILAQYFDFLAKICWKSSNFLFHAYANVRNLTVNKQHNKRMDKAAITEAAGAAVLATMCVEDTLALQNVMLSFRVLRLLLTNMPWLMRCWC